MDKSKAIWTQNDLSCALKEVRTGSMKVLAASKHYNIPRRTLRDYVDDDFTVKKKLGPSFTLSDELREELNARIIRLAEIGYPITMKILRLSVYKYCEEKKLNHRFSKVKQIATPKWARQYVEENPCISIRTAQNLNPARAQKLNRTVVQEHFERFKSVLVKSKLNGKPRALWNMDEKGCRLTLHHSQYVLAEKGAKRVHAIGNEHGENVTIVSCANATGTIIPPMIIFKGKMKRKEWSDDLPLDSEIKMSAKGSMTQELFIEWLKHFAKYKNQGTSILVFDGAKCHLSYDIVDLAEKLDIILYCLPSNTTHELQPMDKSVFKPFESAWDDELSRYWLNNGDRALTKQRFAKIFTPSWQRSMTVENIKAGFKATGLYPYNPWVIPDQAYIPSEVTYQSSIPENYPEPGPSRIDKAPNARADDIDTTEQVSSSGPPNSEVTFHTILPSPKRKKPRDVNRKQSLNSHAVVLTKELFNEVNQNKAKNKVSQKSLPKSVDSKKSMSKNKQTNNSSKLNKTDTNIKQSIAKKRPHNLNSNNNCKRAKKSKGELRDEAWFCKICLEDWIKDMRKCIKCDAFVHEDCVGLTEEDIEDFACPDCID